MSPRVPGFSELSARRMRRVLEKLGYVQVSNKGGSHRKLRAEGRPDITFAFHDGDTVGPHLVRDMKQVGLTLDDARKVVRNA